MQIVSTSSDPTLPADREPRRSPGLARRCSRSGRTRQLVTPPRGVDSGCGFEVGRLRRHLRTRNTGPSPAVLLLIGSTGERVPCVRRPFQAGRGRQPRWQCGRSPRPGPSPFWVAQLLVALVASLCRPWGRPSPSWRPRSWSTAHWPGRGWPDAVAAGPSGARLIAGVYVDRPTARSSSRDYPRHRDRVCPPSARPFRRPPTAIAFVASCQPALRPCEREHPPRHRPRRRTRRRERAPRDQRVWVDGGRLRRGRADRRGAAVRVGVLPGRLLLRVLRDLRRLRGGPEAGRGGRHDRPDGGQEPGGRANLRALDADHPITAYRADPGRDRHRAQ